LDILHEDRSVIAVDKPAGWLLVPFSWQRTQRNLQAAITSSIAAGDYWAKSRNLKFLRHIHRLDGDTSGVLLFGKSPGAVSALSDLFESREVEKVYLAVVQGVPRQRGWSCQAELSPDPQQHGRMRIDPRMGKEAETVFRTVRSSATRTLIEARPLTGRTHQIRLHLIESGHPVVGDDLYGPEAPGPRFRPQRRISFPLALRAVTLAYVDPFTRREVIVRASPGAFLESFGFVAGDWPDAAAVTPAPRRHPRSGPERPMPSPGLPPEPRPRRS
jgi:RluA family pseudouridine synthase